MSFSSELKDELTRVKCSGVDERAAMLCALTHTAGYMIFGAGGLSLEFVIESSATAELAARLAGELYGLPATLISRLQEGLGRENYVASLTGEGCARLLADCGWLPREDDEDYVPGAAPERFFIGERLAKAFMRGAFLGAGSVSDPRKGYHLEVVCRHERFAEILRELLADFEINARISPRKQSYVVYIKEGESIADFLRLVGAVDAMLSFENTRVLRDVANDLNRRTNFEFANMQKSAQANAQQLADIRLIMEFSGLAFLPQPLRETAEARLNNEEASLAELAQELNIGKSGLSHRFAKIAAAAEDIRLHGAPAAMGKGLD